MGISTTNNNKKIAKNTFLLYTRMFIGMLVALYTSRAILVALGVEGYGVYTVVGGFVGFFSIISASLSSAVSRFITFELGKDNKREINKIFSTSIYIHILLAGLILILTETVGLWYVNYHLVIPQEYMFAANYVFQASIITFVINLLSIPYSAIIVAYERMKIFAYVGILDILLKLFIVLFIIYVPTHFNNLILYSTLLCIESIIMQSIYYIYCINNFKECNIKKPTLYPQYKSQISTFAGWNFIGCTAGILKDQGINLLLNAFLGVVVNSARGIANTVNAACMSFVSNFMVALNPQITKSYSQGNKAYTFLLVERGARFSFFVLFLLAMPIIIEADYILYIWLDKRIEHLVMFTRLILILSLIDVISQTLITLQLATGNIRNYQIAVGLTLLMNFPLSYLCLRIGFAPESVYLVAILISLICFFLRLIFLRKMAQLPIAHFIKNVCFKSASVVVVSIIIPLTIQQQMEVGFFRLIITIIVSFTCSFLSFYYIGCTDREKEFLRNMFTRICSKIITLK